jgi:hypothetical protein
MSNLAVLTCADSIGAGNPGPAAHPAWAGSTAYTAVVPGGASAALALTSFVVNGGNYYCCIQGGTSASSGGPTGTALSITDGTAKWAFLGSTVGLNIPCWFAWIASFALASGKTVAAINDGSTGSTSIGWAGTTGASGLWWFTTQAHVDWNYARIIAFMSIGTNDFSAITAATETLTGQQVAANAIGIALQAASAGAIIVMTSCMPTINITGAGETARLAFNAAILAFCSARGYTFVDFSAVAGVTKSDGTHPDAAGHATLANAAWSATVSSKFK